MLADDTAAFHWAAVQHFHDEVISCLCPKLACDLQATEQDLWQLFAPIGEVLELYVLRNGNGRSRGCAFVTFANKFLAQQAVTHLNGRQVPPGKHLVVKFADRSTAGKYF